jgi:hypothetical protein
MSPRATASTPTKLSSKSNKISNRQDARNARERF